MKDSPTFTDFLARVKLSQTLWALQDKQSEDWVVLDSVHFENAEVMPLWSTQEAAEKHCCEEWESYVPAEISLADWFEFWIADLSEDNIVIGIDWQEDESVELELSELSQSLADIEAL